MIIVGVVFLMFDTFSDKTKRNKKILHKRK